MKKIVKLIPIIVILLTIALCVSNWNLIRLKFEDFSHYLFPGDSDGKGELFKIILSVFGAIAVVYGLYISLRRAKAMESGVEKQSESIDNQSKQLELSRKSQIDERFKNAIEHLGSDKEPIILGGIAELHQIAKENKTNYSEVVFNILCSYIKSTADVYTKKADDINHRALQTIVNYLFKKNSNSTYNNLVGNLSYTNLNGLDLTDCNFQNYNLSSCYLPNLNGSNLKLSKLSNSILRTSKLIDVDFSQSDLMFTTFHYCEIKNSIFSGSEISKTVFLECEIEDVEFDNVNFFYDVNFSSSYLKNISIDNCSIVSGDFSCSHIEKIAFSKLELFGSCDFRAASFHEVIINNVITSSKFNGANYDINENPQLYDRRLKARVGKPSELNIVGVQYGKNETGILTEADCMEIELKIKNLEKWEIAKNKTRK
ncbi:pentapeptide repeat protein [Winogradskyella pacifica]|uniref:Pentapeptide repeat protein n=1 Tax=Winogradskyella pacifica TaxID=664642 RepID=A0A3D9N8T9_9FLAO|nr:pentapeptide repeat-containing protein [Winogradskyella pacifica]REE27700.1 pentapeptide repeat protein [Winogradskyella pacifica]